MFLDRLRRAWSQNNSLLCVGLDPDLRKVPRHFLSSPTPLFDFNRAIIDATADLVCAFKPQVAFYSAQKAEDQLMMTIRYIRKHHPGILVILDAKRSDIGNTAEMYATEAFDRFCADAITVNPLLGYDSLQPFLRRPEKGVILLCRTSNPGACEIQDLNINGKSLSEWIAERACLEWNQNRNLLLSMGATYPEEIRRVREQFGDIPFLVPGIGTQGGDVRTLISNGLDAHGTGLILSASRSINYASSDKNFADAARNAALGLTSLINQSRQSKKIASLYCPESTAV